MKTGVALSFLTSAIDGQNSTSYSGRFTPEKIALGTHWIEGCVGPSTGRCGEEKNLAMSGNETRRSSP
jgi:hypothetical protein